MSLTRWRIRVVTPRDGRTRTRCLLRRTLFSASSVSPCPRFLLADPSRFSAALYTVDMAAKQGVSAAFFWAPRDTAGAAAYDDDRRSLVVGCVGS